MFVSVDQRLITNEEPRLAKETAIQGVIRLLIDRVSDNTVPVEGTNEISEKAQD